MYSTNEENIGDLGTVSACPSHLGSSLSVLSPCFVLDLLGERRGFCWGCQPVLNDAGLPPALNILHTLKNDLHYLSSEGIRNTAGMEKQ